MSFHQLKNRLYRLRVEIREEVRRRLEGLYSLIGIRTLEVMMMGWKRAVIGLFVLMLIGGGTVLIHQMGESEKEGAKQPDVNKAEERNGQPLVLTKPVHSYEDDLTFEEFNRLLDELFKSESEDKGEPTLLNSTTSQTQIDQSPDLAYERTENEGRDENTDLITPEVRERVLKLIPEIYDLKQKFEMLVDQINQMARTTSKEEYPNKREEFNRGYEEETTISRELISLGRELKRLIPSGVRLYKRSWLEVIPNMYVVSYTIYVKPEVGDITPEISGYLPLVVVTAPVPEDESLTIADLIRKGKERIRRRGWSAQDIMSMENIRDFKMMEEK